MTEAGTGTLVLDREDTHAGWSVGSSLDATAETMCTELGAYLGRPLTVEGIVAPAPGTIEVRLRTVTPDRSGWVRLTGRVRCEDLVRGTAEAVVTAVRAHDPLSLLVWSLDRNGHLLAAVAREAGIERPTVGPEAEVDRLRRLLDAVPGDGRFGARAPSGDYRVLRKGAAALAVHLSPHPDVLTAADDAIAALEHSLSPLEES